MTDTTTKKSIVPHIVLGVIVILIIVIGYYAFSDDEKDETPYVRPVEVQEPVIEPIVEEPEVEEYVEPFVEPEPIPEPVDTSDAAVKNAVLELADYEAAAALIVNDDLLRRFVVLTDNTAKETVAPNHQITVAPEQKFRVYEQSDRSFIDAASYKRYSAYVDTFDSMDTDELLSLYENYAPAIADIYAEIGDPDEDFKFVLADAINHLLDTPEVPFPVEVYSDSVMYKYKDERLESLSAPQKQLLRTGPENMRRIKAKLRELRDAMQ